jgi:L-lactate utilization protein LutC
MKFYSDTEVSNLIEELSEAAEEAIEKAAAEAARAAVIASLDQEASLLQAKALAVREAQHWREEYHAAKTAGIKTAVITGVICFLGGLAVGGLITRLPAGY